MKRIDEQIDAHYRAKHLSDDRVNRILRARKAGVGRGTIRTAIATAAVLIVGFGLYARYESRQSVTHRVLQEITMNHEKGLDIEVASADYRDLQSRLDRIDFDISPSTEIRGSFELLGGRYCSIQGELAAQLKIRHTMSGIIHTLYVTRMTSELTEIPEHTSMSTGTPIRLWKEGARLFGLAGGPAG